jgi:hypothetical protein
MRVKQKKFDVERRKVWALVLFRDAQEEGEQAFPPQECKKEKVAAQIQGPL